MKGYDLVPRRGRSRAGADRGPRSARDQILFGALENGGTVTIGIADNVHVAPRRERKQ